MNDAALALALLLRQCAPQVHPQTLAAIVTVESSGWPWTIHDNVSGRSYFLPSYGDAVRVGQQLINEGHDPDLGIAQINANNLRSYGLTVASVMQPCTNIATGGSILTAAYEKARRQFGSWADANPQMTVRYAISAYNTGSLFAGSGYVAKVVSAAGSIGEVPTFSAPTISALPPPRRVVIARAPAKYEKPKEKHGMVVTMMPAIFEPLTVRATKRDQ